VLPYTNNANEITVLINVIKFNTTLQGLARACTSYANEIKSYLQPRREARGTAGNPSSSSACQYQNQEKYQ
jgi:hypothetical protein